jgi:predicted AlkP superfamily pyrophosphatase or phosphodiesterase
MKDLKFIGSLFLLINTIPLAAQSDTTQQITSNRVNDPAQQNAPYVILISADGFRHDFAAKYNAFNLMRFSRQGAAASWMIPCYPSLTFPNHYSLVTGLYPAHHGLVDNSFYDPHTRTTYNKNNKKMAGDGAWYGGTPLWVLAEQHHLLTASFYWTGSEADIGGIRPTYYYQYNEKIPMARRLQVVKKWLTLPEATRPHLITFYFPEVDHEAHDFGPDSPEVRKAVALVDKAVARLVAMTDSLKLPVNFVFVSDHGMTNIDIAHPLAVPAALDTACCITSAGSTQLHVFVKNKSNIDVVFLKLKKEAKDFDVYRESDIPPAWHYGVQDDRFGRVGDILVATHLHKVFVFNGKPPKPGNHGFDPANDDMHATFLAWGPLIKKSGTIAPFENIHVYPFVAQLLGLPLSSPIDGDPAVLKPILK